MLRAIGLWVLAGMLILVIVLIAANTLKLPILTPRVAGPTAAASPQETAGRFNSDDLVNSSTWATFTNPEDFYSIQYPNLGTFVVAYTPILRQTILGWNNVGDFGIVIGTIIPPNALHLGDWIKTIPSIVDSADAIATSTVNGMEAIIVKNPDAQTVTVYIEQDFYGEPLIHVVEFDSKTHGYTYPPFWELMLQTFRGLPWQA